MYLSSFTVTAARMPLIRKARLAALVLAFGMAAACAKSNGTAGKAPANAPAPELSAQPATANATAALNGKAPITADRVKVFGPAPEGALKGTVTAVAWSLPEGQLRLSRAKAKQDFLQLAPLAEVQINPLYCGIASAVTVMNARAFAAGQEIPAQKAAEVSIPKSMGGGKIPLKFYLQSTFLDAKTEPAKPRAVIELRAPFPKGFGGAKDVTYDPGLTLAQLGAVMSRQGATVEVKHASLDLEEGTSRLRDDLKAVLADADKFILVNFQGKQLGAPTGGHISPLGAYDEASDSVLIMDVAGELNPWYWVPVAELYRSMHTVDGTPVDARWNPAKVSLDGKAMRGWLVIR